MAQYPSVIALSSLNGANGFRLSGGAGGDQAGGSVASAGDINRDGFADVIVGAHRADPGGSNSGASYVVFGKAGGFASNINLSALNGVNGFRLSGAAPSDESGTSAASAGDVNGDGFADMIVGAPGADPHGSSSGASYVVFGRAAAFSSNLDLSALNGTNGFRLAGVFQFDESGAWVASAGNVNGDGFADLVIGAPLADPNGGNSGASYVVFGKAAGFGSEFKLSALNGGNGFRIAGVDSGDRSGQPVASAGDVNNDGRDDVLIDALGSSNVVFGKAGGFASNLNLSSLDGNSGFRISGITEVLSPRGTAASAGDVDGDGFADVIVGAPGASPNGSGSGASYVVFGKVDGFASNLDVSALNGANGFRISGVFNGDQSGRRVASAGDVNGDGFADLLIGAPAADPIGASSGASYVVFGKVDGFASNIDLSELNGTNGFRLTGVASFEYSGLAVASAGDVNGDGFADLHIGAPLADANGFDSGRSYVVLGRKPDTAVNRTGTIADQTLAGGDLNDTLSGLGGNDMLYGHGGRDSLDGGAGNDTVTAGAGNDRVSGGAGRDRLAGGDGNDALSGGTSNDTLAGGRGADTLFGDAGNDALSGNAGNDLLNGGFGADIFYFSGGGGSDVVGDFEDNLDEIRLGSNLGVGTVNEALARAIQDGNDVVFNFANGEVLRVLNTTKAALADDLEIT